MLLAYLYNGKGKHFIALELNAKKFITSGETNAKKNCFITLEKNNAKDYFLLNIVMVIKVFIVKYKLSAHFN